MKSVLLLGFAILSSLSFGEGGRPTVVAPEKSETFKNILKTFDQQKVESVDSAIPTLVEKYSGGFTATAKSGSFQGKQRVILFGVGSETLAGVGAKAKFLEFADNTDSKDGIVPYEVTFEGKSKAMEAHPFPGRCADCHTDKFVYIFKQYREWPGFLGAVDDKQDPNDPDYKTLKANKRFAPFFEHSKTLPGMQDRTAAPYFAPGEKQQMIAAPNTFFTMVLVKRAARALWNRARFAHPERYQKVRLLLLGALRCEDAKYPPPLKSYDTYPGKKETPPEILAEWNEIWANFEKEFQNKVPADAKKWDSIIKEAAKKHFSLRDVPALKILDYLGVQPHQIILTQPWSGKKPLDSFENYKELMVTYLQNPFDEKEKEPTLPSPLSFTSDLDQTRNPLAALVEEESSTSYPDLKLASELKTHLKYMGQDPPTDSVFEKGEKYFAALDKITKRDGDYGPEKDARYCDDLRKKLKSMSFMTMPTPGTTQQKKPDEH